MLFFIRVVLFVVFLHNNGNPKTEIGTKDWEYCCDRPDHVFVWKNIDVGTLDLESHGMV